jgi:hypothetical protein
VVQVVEFLPNKNEALSSNPSTAKKKKVVWNPKSSISHSATPVSLQQLISLRLSSKVRKSPTSGMIRRVRCGECK